MGFFVESVLNYGIIYAIMIPQEVFNYASKVFEYWQSEYDHHIGDESDDLINNHVISMIILDCYRLKLNPPNCCGVIYNCFFSMEDKLR